MEIVCSCIQSCIQPCISCIGTPVIRQFGYLLKAKENVDKLIGRAGDVEAKKKDIQYQIDAASRDGRQPTHEVTRWIQKVEGLKDEVTTVQSDYDQRGRCGFHGCRLPNCCSSYKIGRRASKLLIKLEDLVTEHAGFDVLATEAPPPPVQHMSTTSNVVGKMITSNKEKICGYLREETDGAVIGIWGMGGVGKTTLLEAVNNNFLNNNGNSVTNKLFDHVIFVVVSKEHQLQNLQKIIVKKLGLRSSDDLDSQAQIIYEYLKEKNFLLLLDDIWKVVQLKYLGIPDPHSSSSGDGRRFRRKVVFTTRSMQVCKRMNCRRRIIKVECLKTDEAWNLFKEKVGEDIIDLPDIKSRAEEVIKECGGLPLALVVIGRAMASKESPQEWDYALTQLKKSQPIPGTETEEYYFPRLKFSYDSLGDDQMRDCFLCCSLWPEDFEIKKEEIIMCWMGLGLIDDIEDINEAYNEGYFLIGSLTAASLLEDNDDVIKLHDVIRDLALWIARDSGTNKNKWLVKAGVGLEKVPNEVVAKREVAKVAERVSLMKNSIKELPPHLPPCPNLSTLLLQGNDQLSRIPESFFTCMPILTYLDLSRTRLQEIPKEICCLVQLRYLNLSRTNISSLPEELGQLINLKYMLLHRTKLGEVIRGIIGRLVSLEYLDLFPHGIVDTDELLRLPLLKALGMKIRSEHALPQLFRVPILQLNIEDMGDSTTTSIHLHHLLSSCTQVGLRELRFTDCHRISELVVDVDVRLPRLESLQLFGLPKLTEIAWRRSVVPPSECFQRLRKIVISNCNGLKDITWVLHLPCLEELRLSECDEIERLVVIGGGGEEEEITKATTFPSLSRLSLYKLPKLAMICDNHAAVNFPSLEDLHVTYCNGLKDITWVLHLPCLEELHLKGCDEIERLVVIGGGGEEEEEITKATTIFPSLRLLSLSNLPKLAMICDNHAAAAAAAVNFPSLEWLFVSECNELKKLPFHPQEQQLNNNNCSRLKVIVGEREWWEGIEWESAHQSSLLQPYFKGPRV